MVTPAGDGDGDGVGAGAREELLLLPSAVAAAAAEEFSANRRQQKCDNISMKLFINRLAHIALAHSLPCCTNPIPLPPSLPTGSWI